MASQVPDGREIVQQLHEKHHNGQLEPSDDKVESCLYHVIGISEDAYIIIDALDECNERHALLAFLKTLVNECGNHLHLLMTSRQEHDITEELSQFVVFPIGLQSQLVDRDINLYVQEILSKDLRMKKWPDQIKEEILTNLISKADGM